MPPDQEVMGSNPVGRWMFVFFFPTFLQQLSVPIKRGAFLSLMDKAAIIKVPICAAWRLKEITEYVKMFTSCSCAGMAAASRR